MIVVVGTPVGREDDGIRADGTASRVALAAAAAGASVQIVGRIGDDPVADAVVLDLARHGVGHAALLRDPTRATPLSPTHPSADDEATTWADDPDVAPGPGQAPGRPGPDPDPADIDLGLRYLTDFQVVVLTEHGLSGLVHVVSEAARWAAARMILVVTAGAELPRGLPDDVIVLEAPGADTDGAFADMVGTLAARLEQDGDVGAAFQASIAAVGWETTPAD